MSTDLRLKKVIKTKKSRGIFVSAFCLKESCLWEEPRTHVAQSDPKIVIYLIWLREKFYPEKKSTPEKVYPGKNPQFWSNQADIGET